jgi:hypothetical protein
MMFLFHLITIGSVARLFASIWSYILGAADSLIRDTSMIVANMLNKLSGQPESYEKKYGRTLYSVASEY